MSALDYLSLCSKVGCYCSDTVFHCQRPSFRTVAYCYHWITTRATEASQASEAAELKAFDMQTNSKSSEATPKMRALL